MIHTQMECPEKDRVFEQTLKVPTDQYLSIVGDRFIFSVHPFIIILIITDLGDRAGER